MSSSSSSSVAPYFSHLRSLHSLSDAHLSLYSQELEHKLSLSRQQLTASLRSQVEESRLGLELLDESTQLIRWVRQSFREIDRECVESRQLLPDFSTIQRVSTARKNLDSTLRLTSKFQSIPDQCDRLMDMLDDNDRAIKDVYLGLRRLIQLRNSARTTMGMSGNSNLSKFFEESLGAETEKCIKELTENLEERIMENLLDAELLAKEDPVTLVRTLEVVETEELAKRKLFVNGGSGIGNHKEEKENGTALSIRDKCLHELEKAIADAFAHLLRDEAEAKRIEQEEEREKLKKKKAAIKAKKMAEREKLKKEGKDLPEESESEFQTDDESAAPIAAAPADSGVSDYVCTILDELRELIDHLPSILECLVPCFPPHYDISAFYHSRYRHWIKLCLHFHVNEAQKLSKRALLVAVQFLQWYIMHLRELRELDTPNQNEFERMINELMKAFCDTTENTILTLVDNILSAEETATAETDSDGFYTTSGPSDLFYTINQQMDIVLNSFGLHALALAHVCRMLVDIFAHYQRSQLKFLGSIDLIDDTIYFGDRRLEKDDKYFCAVINNCQQSQDHMDELKEKCIERIEEEMSNARDEPLANADENSNSSAIVTGPPKIGEKSRLKALISEMEELFEDCGSGFVTVASEAVDILVLQILTTLQGQMQSLFTAKWLKEASAIRDIVTTIEDFLSDYEKWIAREAYFIRIIKNTLHSFVQEYLRKFVDSKPLLSVELFDGLSRDRAHIQDYFMRFVDAGTIPPGPILNSLELIDVVKEVLHAEAEFIQVHFEKLVAAFGASSLDLFEHLIALRQDISRNERKEIIESFQQFRAKQAQAQDSASGISATLQQLTASQSSSGSGFASFWNVFKQRPKAAIKGGNPQPQSNSSGSSAGQAKKPQRRDDDEQVLKLSDFLG